MKSHEKKELLTKGNAGKALIYCADISGHRHLYAAYFIRFYLEHGYEVLFCYAGRITRHLPDGSKRYEPTESPYLDIYKEGNRVHLRNICHELNNTKSEANLIRDIQSEVKADLSMFVDGDILRWIFLGQLLPWRPRLVGRNFCVICLSEFIYSRGSMIKALRELILFIKKFFTNRADLAGRGLFVRKFPLLTKCLWRNLSRFKLFNTAFCLDPGLVKHYNSKRILFLPELITRDLNARITTQKSEFNKKVERRYRDFLAKHKDKHILLMFGDLEPRKGYDLLLQLAASEPGCVCIRFGRTKSNYSPTWEAILSKEKLIVEERIFEHDIYIDSQELKDFIFSTVKFIVLPYRRHYRSSSLLVDFLHRGFPVLTINRGAMANIVKSYGVGRLFREGEFKSLLEEFLVFKNDYKNYLENIEKFKQAFSKESIDKVLSVTL